MRLELFDYGRPLRVFDVDPLRCPRFGGQMRIVTLLLDSEIIHLFSATCAAGHGG